MKFHFGIPSRLKYMYSRHNEPEVHHAFAILYWKTLVACASIALIAVACYGIWTLITVLDIIGTPAATIVLPAPPINHEQLTATISAFDARKTQFEYIQTHGATFVDPSK